MSGHLNTAILPASSLRAGAATATDGALLQNVL